VERAGNRDLWRCNDEGEPPPTPEVATVTVAPASATINVGANLSFAGTALDISSQPINGTPFTWTSTNTLVASVSATGVATALAEGDSTIVATGREWGRRLGHAARDDSDDTRRPPTSTSTKSTTTTSARTPVKPSKSKGRRRGCRRIQPRPVQRRCRERRRVQHAGPDWNSPASCGTRGVLTVAYPSERQFRTGLPTASRW